jgi:hypothetical protein
MAANKIPSDLQWADLASRIKAKADSSSLATVATSGSYNDLSNKPTIPAAQVNSDWDASTGVAQILNKPNLAAVATSGSYNDLSNKPTIPTVNNATITIQKNSTKVDDFTANQATNKTINITVPTTAADVSALPASTLYGASFELSINSSTYVVTATLKDQNGDTLGTAQTIDLPLESVVVSGSYDSTNKKIVLTLQSGSTIDIPVGDLVAGLQAEITSDNKLSSDLVSDTGHTNKFATASQLSKLNSLPAITTIGANLSLSSGTLSATDTTYSAFTGADGTSAGTSGLVPAPAKADNVKYLKGDGTWGDPTFVLPTASSTTLGGIKVGTNLSINSSTGVLSADAQVAEFTTSEWNALWA